MQPHKPSLRRRLANRYHVISKALKGRRKKAQETNNGGSKAISEQPPGGPGPSSEIPVVATSTSVAENGPTVEQPSTKPDILPVAESEASKLVAKAENSVSRAVVERSLLAEDNGTTAVETLAATDQDQGFRILNAGGNAISTDYKDFIDHALSEDLIDQPTISSGEAVSCSSSKFFDCKFSTGSIQKAFEVPQIGDIKDSIVLGLQTVGNASNGVTIATLISTFEIDESDLSEPFTSIFKAFGKPVDNTLPTFDVVAEDGLRNGTWIKVLDANTLEVTTSLTWRMTSGTIDLSSAQNGLKSASGLLIEASHLSFTAPNVPLIRLTHRAFISQDENGISTSTLFEAFIELPILGFLVNLKTQTGGSVNSSVIRPLNGGSLANLASLLSGGLVESTVSPTESGLFSDIELWKVSSSLSSLFADQSSTVSFMISFFVTLQLPGHPLTIALSYSTESGTFTGQLMVKSAYQGRLDPNFDELGDLPRGKWKTLLGPPDLRSAGPFAILPKFIPTKLDSAVISYKKASGSSPYEFSFSASLVSDASTQPTAGGDVPFPFDWSSFKLQYFRRGAGSGGNTGLDILTFATSFQLDSLSGRFRSGSLDMGLTYTASNSGSSWILSGSARYIQLGAIIEFFDRNLKNGVVDVIGKLSLDALDVVYTVDSESTANSPTATSFLISGTIGFGELKLKLFYQYASAETINAGQTAAEQTTGNANLKPLDKSEVKAGAASAWRFDAYLDVGGPGATVGMIADSFVDGASKSLPVFVRDIQIEPPAGSPDGHLISFHTGKATKKLGTSTQEGIVFLLNVSISTLEFSFEQVSFSTDSQTTNTKRLLRVSVGKLPLLNSLPVVKELPQPWSKLQYMWIPTGGFTRTEVTVLNEKLQVDSPDNKLYFKPATRDAVDDSVTTDPEVLVGGHHFIVVVDGDAVLDHVFAPDLTPEPDDQQPPGDSVSSPDEKPPTKGAMKKSIGTLSVSGLSLQYKQNHLYVFLDATLALGPLSFSLIGFGVGLNISKLKLNDLSKLGDTSVKDLIDFQLHGMEVSFDNPPVLIAGCFYHDIFQRGDQTIDAYRGGIALTIPPYTFLAVGEYAQVKEGETVFKSVFVFAKLDGPIIDFEFAILSGLRIGFGYNSIVRSPAVEELGDFPLISSHASEGAGNDPMAILEKMTGGDNPYVQLKNDEYWLAFGFTISSFDLISATAVALVQFGGAGPVFRIFGDLTIAYPPDEVSAAAKVFFIEVVMMAELNFAEDCFKIEAALAPSSFVFVPYCRLKGGLALYTFFGNNPHAGDWVFTVGGYHRAFQVPAHYPTAPRLGLDFNISIIAIRGECYFAITPKAIMTGAMMRCEIHIGPIFAWMDTTFDAMVQFSPLHYWVSMGVEVGVECRVPVLFCTIKIRISIGAQLEIEGPEFGGTAYVDFWFFSFSFDFGNRVGGPPPISLSEFYALCEKSGPPDDSPSSQATEDLVVELKLSLEDGAFSMPTQDKSSGAPPDDTGAGTKWFVKGGSFQFRVSSVFALTSADLETEDSAKRQTSDGTTLLLEKQDTSLMQEVHPGSAPSSLSALPMDLSASGGDTLTSRMCIAIQDIDPAGETVEGFKSELVFKEMPLTLWADPKNPPDRLTSEKGTIQLPMAVTLSAPDPVLAYAKIPEFNATDMAKLCAGANQVPDLPAVPQSELLPEPVTNTTSTPTEQWTAMQQTWTNASTQNIELANSLTELCMSQLGWDKPRPDVAAKAALDGSEPWKLPVEFPLRLITGTGREASGIEDGLDSFYLELPRTTTAVVH